MKADDMRKAQLDTYQIKREKSCSKKRFKV
jgi:hypothetical protein